MSKDECPPCNCGAGGKFCYPDCDVVAWCEKNGSSVLQMSRPAGNVRTFETGATRDTDEGKLDFEGFFAPGVMYAFARYMDENRVQSDGSVRDSDNWQKGIPRDQYMKSMYRHFMEVWGAHRCDAVKVSETALCAMMFNVMGYMFEMQQGR